MLKHLYLLNFFDFLEGYADSDNRRSILAVLAQQTCKELFK